MNRPDYTTGRPDYTTNRPDHTGAMLSIVERALLIMEIDIFRGLPSEQVARIAARTAEQRHEAGSLIPNPERGMFLVIEGRIEFLVDGKAVRQFTPGMTFGLSALLSSSPEDEDPGEAHQVRAAEASHLLYLPKENFLELITDQPEVAMALLKRLSGMVVDLLARVGQLEQKPPGSSETSVAQPPPKSG